MQMHIKFASVPSFFPSFLPTYLPTVPTYLLSLIPSFLPSFTRFLIGDLEAGVWHTQHNKSPLTHFSIAICVQQTYPFPGHVCLILVLSSVSSQQQPIDKLGVRLLDNDILIHLPEPMQVKQDYSLSIFFSVHVTPWSLQFFSPVWIKIVLAVMWEWGLLVMIS